jgi:thymidylate kinase
MIQIEGASLSQATAVAPAVEARPIEAAMSGALETTAALFATLNRDGIRYCHWKSNLRLARGLLGKTDLDLLIDLAHAERFQERLRHFDIRRVLAPPGKRYPSIEDYLGFDRATGVLFHLHVHYRLVLGEQFVKNYSLPLEEPFLDSARIQQDVKIPAPELELMVLSLRALLKYRDRDGVKDILGIRTPGIPAHILEEIHWLASQTSTERAREVTAQLLGPQVADTVADFLRLVVESPRDGRKMLQLRRDARTSLRDYRRDGRRSAVLRYMGESIRRRNRLRFGPQRKMTLPDGGVSLALVGADGAGKTTVASELATWLGQVLDTRRFYLGSKQPSWLSDWLYLIFRVFRRGQRDFSTRFGPANVVSRVLAGGRQSLLYAHYLSVAVDRYRRQRAGQSAALRGAIILYDRFPLAASLDGPQIREAAADDVGSLARPFARLEEAIYGRFQPPDLFFILQVDPDTSISRKPDHNRATIEAKARLLKRLVEKSDPLLAQSRLAIVDAGRPLARVVADMKESVWANL